MFLLLPLVIFLGAFVPLIAEEPCPFCTERVIEAQTVYEGKVARVLYPHRPIYPAHFLIIPKRHVEYYQDLSQEEICEMGELVQRVHTAAGECFSVTNYILLQKNGRGVGQQVPHVHIHYVAPTDGKTGYLDYAFRSWYWHFFSPLSREEMAPMVETMRHYLHYDKFQQAQ